MGFCMNITFTFLNGMSVDEASREYVRRKVLAAGKSLRGAVKAEVEIDRDKRGAVCVCVSLHSERKRFRAEEKAETVMSAIDLVEEKLQEQVRDNKDRLVALRRRGGRSVKKKMVLDENARF